MSLIILFPPIFGGINKLHCKSNSCMSKLLSYLFISFLKSCSCFQIAVEVSVNSIPGLEASQACGLLQSLLNELKKDDILVKLTALEMVTKLALCHHGYEYLERKSVISQLAEAISGADQDPLSSFIMPGKSVYLSVKKLN